MYVPLSSLPGSARIWLYQADRQLTAADVAGAEIYLRNFCETWVAHGQPLRVSFAVVRNRFLLLAADETAGAPSGCSIDSSVHMLRELGTKLGLDLLDKSQIAYLTEPDTLTTVPRSALRAAVADGQLRPETMIFDNTVSTIGAWRTAWPHPAAQTWLERYFVGIKQP